MSPARWLASCGLALALLAAAAAPAAALTCRTWTRLGPDERLATIERMIAETVGGSAGRSYRIDRAAVGRCLRSQAEAMAHAFDGACEDPRTAGLQALNRIFKDYIWSCAG